MSDSISKRNRSGNFDQADIDLFLNLVNEHKALIDSGKQEDKKKGWELVHDSFNENCIGVKRDVGALRNKLKNLKAMHKKQKLDESSGVERLDESQESELDTSVTGGDTKSGQKKSLRKRGKIFSSEETSLLQELVEKHFNCLDSSLSRDNLEQRNKAWQTITQEFNRANINDIYRDISELRIKHKNMKAQRVNFKSENDKAASSIMDETYIDPVPEESVRTMRSKTLHNDSVPTTRNQLKSAPTRYSLNKNYDIILESLEPDFTDDDLDDDDYVQPLIQPKRKIPTGSSTASTSEDKEEARMRKENLVLKNAVLRKKERLLELQIALAERNLRRHQY